MNTRLDSEGHLKSINLSNDIRKSKLRFQIMGRPMFEFVQCFLFFIFSSFSPSTSSQNLKTNRQVRMQSIPSQSIRVFLCLACLACLVSFLFSLCRSRAHKTKTQPHPPPHRFQETLPINTIVQNKSNMIKNRRFEAIVQSWRESNRDRLNCSRNGEDASCKRSTKKHTMRLTAWLQNQKHALVQEENSYHQPMIKSIDRAPVLLGNANERQDETGNVTGAKSR